MSAFDTLFRIAPHLEDGLVQGPGHVMVRCPFHSGGHEQTPSMSISTWKPVWFCHACKRAGHMAQLLGHFGLGRASIDRVLPKEAGGYSKPENIAVQILRGTDPFRGRFTLNEAILDTYRMMPTSLKNAGYKAKTLRHFEVGYDSRNLRITYPLRTAFGDLVGISGRTILDGVEPRYKVYDRELKERTDFSVPASYTMEEVKSAVLWHAHVVRPLFFIRNKGKEPLIITEGFKACMWTWQAGVEDTVALVGSYLTPAHAELIARATRKVVLFLDNNAAGYKGTASAGRLLLKKGVEVCVARYPDEREQPDDLSPEEIHEATTHTQSIRSWLIDHHEPEAVKKYLRRVSRPAYIEN